MCIRPLTLLVCLLALGCTQEAPPPPVPPPPEDLSTWAVPELVQPEPTRAGQALTATRPAGAAEKLYDFSDGTLYKVAVPLGAPLDIILERGEQLRNLAGGDPEKLEPGQETRRWEVKEGADGLGETQQPHVFIRATESGLKMGLILTTTKRTYYLTCESVKTSPVRAIRWKYTPDSAAPVAKTKEPGLLPDPQEPRRYHVGYELTTSQPKPDWAPRHVIDDGKKLYIVYPEVTLFGSVPVVRVVGPQGPQLVNARQLLNVVMVDLLPARAELRVGTGERAETVTITRGQLQTITCPGDEACPIWPQAATTLAGRQP